MSLFSTIPISSPRTLKRVLLLVAVCLPLLLTNGIWAQENTPANDPAQDQPQEQGAPARAQEPAVEPAEPNAPADPPKNTFEKTAVETKPQAAAIPQEPSEEPEPATTPEPEAVEPAPEPAKPTPPPSTSYPSFAVQGEYQGWMVVDGRQQDYSLQVVGTGKNKVRAVLLIGKLPGLGTREFSSASFDGAIQEDGKLDLSSESGITLIYHAGSAQFIQTSPKGETLAQFTKVQRVSPTMGLAPPENAMVLFGEEAQHLNGAETDAEGLLTVGSITDFPVNGFQLHLEFKIPYQPNKSQQGRGNSGVYIQRRYEIQILDSFGEPARFNYCGSIYRQQPPRLVMSLPPEQWQTYDIWFTPAKWNGNQKIANARITVKHNGVTIHDNAAIANKTGAGQQEGPTAKPILFQDHGDPVRFRNIWLVPAEPISAEAN